MNEVCSSDRGGSAQGWVGCSGASCWRVLSKLFSAPFLAVVYYRGPAFTTPQISGSQEERWHLGLTHSFCGVPLEPQRQHLLTAHSLSPPRCSWPPLLCDLVNACPSLELGFCISAAVPPPSPPRGLSRSSPLLCPAWSPCLCSHSPHPAQPPSQVFVEGKMQKAPHKMKHPALKGHLKRAVRT